MVASILISPFAGAVIGCFTNYIAIKMLFRPYKEIKIGNIRLPFTPGLIPKEKQRIAMAIGSAVGDKILTGEAVGKSLVKEDIINYITNAVSEAYDCAEENGITINDVGKNFKVGIWEEFSQKMSDRISVLLGEAFSSDGFKEAFSDLLYRYISIGLNKKISEIGCEGILNAVTGAVSNSVSEAFENGSINAAAEKAVWDFLLSMQDDQRKICNAVSFSAVAEFKDYAAVKVPDLVNAVLSITDNPDIELILKERLSDILHGIAGPFMGMFINTDDIYCKIITDLTEYFNNPENSGEIEQIVESTVDNFAEKTVGEAVQVFVSQIRENSVNRLVSFVLDEAEKNGAAENIGNAIKGFVERNSQMTVYELLVGANKNFGYDIEKYLHAAVGFISENIGSVIDRNMVKAAVDGFMNMGVTDILKSICGGRKEAVVELVAKVYKGAVLNLAPGFIQSLDLSKIVEERINSFDMEYTEEIILSVARKELSAITALGGVLGFVIGLMPVVLSFI